MQVFNKHCAHWTHTHINEMCGAIPTDKIVKTWQQDKITQFNLLVLENTLYLVSD